MNAKQLLVAVLSIVLGAPSYAAPGDQAGVGEDIGQWSPAARIDNGLGALPPFASWTYTWLYSTPADKVDSGLGELPPFKEWNAPWLHSIPADKGAGESPSVAISAHPPGVEARTR